MAFGEIDQIEEEEKIIFSGLHVLHICRRKTQPNQTKPGQVRPYQEQANRIKPEGFVCACVGMSILCAENAERLACGSESLCTQKCLHISISVCVHIVPGSSGVKVFPCVSSYYSVGGHTEGRGDV